MKTSQAEQVYWDALERLITNTAKIVDTKSSRFKLTRDAVDREAGKGKGYVRNERYPKLCGAIKKAEEERKNLVPKTLNGTAKLKHEKELKLIAKSKYITLKKEYDLLMQDYLNILRQNFELQSELVDSSNARLVRGADK
ncbi:hypothetical protein I6E84_10285 [Psychrobacter sp. SCQQ22]|uniref:hypothetical protein n=1 Tax=Psychrobacter sp. SCQQ22 TaxID=2792059 RepID=UPI0018CDA9C8|nr:hypothetical protein [Psychrobacter sp. SCQQ22]MBH0086604.1 hypothetical protein [Psychrobacter sp. SCQQ22]